MPNNAIIYSKMSILIHYKYCCLECLWKILISNNFESITYEIRIIFMSSNIFRNFETLNKTISMSIKKIRECRDEGIQLIFHWLIKFSVSLMLEIWRFFKSHLLNSSIMLLISDNVIVLLFLCFILIFDLMLLIKCSHGFNQGEYDWIVICNCFYSLNAPLFDLSYEWMRYQQ